MPHQESPETRQRVIGVLGGLGPFAHIEFERRLLAAVEGRTYDQEVPEWVVVSVSRTPDRTEALLGRGPSPVPALVRGLDLLASVADFAVITCMTAHAYLDEVRSRSKVPILDAVELTMTEVAAEAGESARVGLLATLGSLTSGVFHRAKDRVAPRLELLSPLDLENGERMLEQFVTRPIYGPLAEGRRICGGIKSGSDRDPETGVLHRDTLAAAVKLLAAEGVSHVIAGCTEIPLALGRTSVGTTRLIDPLDLSARAAIKIAMGELGLP